MLPRQIRTPGRIAVKIAVVLALFIPAEAYAEPGATALYEEGSRAQLQGNYYRAIELYKDSLSRNSSYVKPMVGLAESFYALGQNDEALNYALQAQKFDRSNLDLINLEGNIRTELGELQKARQLFEGVLKIEPHNLEAKFGLALLDLANGRKRQAASRFRDALKSSPENVRILLRLAMLYEELGDIQSSATYLEQALRFHSNNPLVYLTAGRYYFNRDEFESAIEYLQTALSLRSGYNEAKLLLGMIYIAQDKPNESISLLQEVLSSQRPDQLHLARYTLGIAYGRTGMVEEALNSFTSALRLKPEDEVSRIAAENLSLKFPDETRDRRAGFARFHLEEGKKMEQMSRLDKALSEYRRSLRLDHTLAEARWAYGNLYRILGYPIKYLTELLLLKEYYQSRDTKVLDDIEVYSKNLEESVSNQWADKLKPFRDTKRAFDQYAIDKSTHSLLLADLKGRQRVIHPDASRELGLYVQDLLLRYDIFTLKSEVLHSQSFDAVFRQARETGADFFLTLAFSESERSFQIVGELHLARTGSLLKSFSVFRTGNNRIKEALLRFASQVRESFPLRGALLAREFDRGIVNLGTMQQIKAGDVFDIIKKGKLRYSPNSIGYSFEEQDILGSFTVERTDENLSEGSITPSSFFDRINPGDELILKPSTGS
jgi:tetratricopeptide (TPR) repeat protein